MLPRKLQELWDGMEENRRITLGMVSGLSRERMTEAPEVAHPKGSYGKEEILGLAAQVREATRESLTMLAGSDPRSVEFPHPFFGSMNLYEWPHRIIREHENQHHPQIERILRSRGK